MFVFVGIKIVCRHGWFLVYFENKKATVDNTVAFGNQDRQSFLQTGARDGGQFKIKNHGPEYARGEIYRDNPKR